MNDHNSSGPGNWDAPHVAVVFIHGVGEQERGDTLMNFASPIVRWMTSRLADKFVTQFGTSEPKLESYPREGGRRAYSRLTVGDHRFELTEAHWATAFRPLPNDLLIRWAFWFLPLMWWWNLTHFVRDILAHPGCRRIGWWHTIYDFVHALLLAVIFIPGVLLGILLIALLWLTDSIPLPNVIPNAVASALKGVMNFIVEGIGDIAAYMEDPARRDAIRQVVEDILGEYQSNSSCSKILVLAHSQGTVVAYDVLSGAPQTFNKCDTLINIGSVLSPVQRMYRDHRVFQSRLQQPLRWIFMYARYDPGPGGPLSDWFQPEPDSQDVDPLQILVDNRDTIIEDHVTYSTNYGQVISLIVDEMFRDLGSDSPYFRDGRQDEIDFNERRQRVGQLAFGRTLTYVILAYVFGFFVWAAVSNATPATSMLNGLIQINGIKQTFGQSVKILYRVPSAEDGSITVVPLKQIEAAGGPSAFKTDRTGYVVAVTDENDQPIIVPRSRHRVLEAKAQSGAWTYATDEANLRTGIGNLVVWKSGFRYLVIPAFFAILLGLGLFILFRLYRDIIWKSRYDRWHKRRHREYREWRQAQP